MINDGVHSDLLLEVGCYHKGSVKIESYERHNLTKCFDYKFHSISTIEYVKYCESTIGIEAQKSFPQIDDNDDKKYDLD